MLLRCDQFFAQDSGVSQLKIISLLTLLVAGTSFSSLAAASGKAGTGPDLLAACQALQVDPEQDSAMPCVYFVRGFLVAALDRNTIKVEAKMAEGDNSSSYLKRVYEIGLARKADRIVARPTRLCIPIATFSSVEIEALIIKRLISPRSKPIGSAKMLGPRIVEALSTEFPC